MNKTRITVLISIYNSSDTLDRCFQSIFNQTYKDISIICIDDASTDNSNELLHKWQRKIGKTIIIKNSINIGLTKSLNKGLKLVNTKYVARIDADDWWDTIKLEKQIHFLNQNPEHKIIGSNYINVYNSNNKKIVLYEKDSQIRRTIIKKNPFAHSCVIFENNLVKKVGGYDNKVRFGQDYDLWLRCLPHTKFHNIQEFLCFRSVNKGISIESQKKQMWQGVKTQIKYIKKYNLPLISYIYTIELLMLIIIPDFIKKIKRKILL